MNPTRIAIVALALLATACTSGGNATTGTPTAGSTETKSPTSSNNSSSDDKLASVKPCELISSADASQLGITGTAKPDKIASSEACSWTDKNLGLTIALNLKESAEDLNYKSGTKTPGKYGQYDGYKVSEPNGGKGLCHVVIAVTGSSNVQIVGNGVGTKDTDTTEACELATKSADLVAAKLV